jgi:hypothetical protein
MDTDDVEPTCSGCRCCQGAGYFTRGEAVAWERAAIVKWLRMQARRRQAVSAFNAVNDVADDIEHGEHVDELARASAAVKRPGEGWT